jgi:hypothetical protein
MRDYFATRYRLETAIENAYRIDGFQDILDTMFCDSLEIPEEGLVGPSPYWLEEGDPFTALSMPGPFKVAESKYPNLEPGAVTLTREDLEDCPTHVLHVGGIWSEHKYGEIDWLRIDGEPFKVVCVGSVCLPAETEHQSADGGLVYEYRGDAHLEVFVKVEDVTKLTDCEDTVNR